jgi:hypothetical protein
MSVLQVFENIHHFFGFLCIIIFAREYTSFYENVKRNQRGQNIVGSDATPILDVFPIRGCTIIYFVQSIQGPFGFLNRQIGNGGVCECQVHHVCRLMVILFVRGRHNVQEKSKTFFDVSLVYFFVVSGDDQTYGVQDASVQSVLHVVLEKLGA